MKKNIFYTNILDMDNSFLEFKLKRVKIAQKIKEKNVKMALREYFAYKKILEKNFYFKFFNRKEFKEEIKTLEKFLFNKLEILSKEFFSSKDYNNAILCYEFLYSKNKLDLKFYQNYITCLEEFEQFDIALEIARDLVKKSDIEKNYKILSKSLGKCNKFHEAVAAYEKACKLSGKEKFDSIDNNTIACFYFNSYIQNGQNPSDANEALKYFIPTIEENPNTKLYLKNTILAALKAKNWEIEKKCWQQYLKNGFANAEDEFTYCASCFRNCEFEQWGKYYDSRFRRTTKKLYPDIDSPLWTGQDLTGKTLLIHFEQGFGDNFLMYGYIPRLSKMAKKVIYITQNSISKLIKNSNELDNVKIYAQKDVNLKTLAFDYHIPCMSLPIAMKLDKNTLKVGGGYIKAPSDLVEEYRKKYFNNKKLKIGISYLSTTDNHKRDIPLDKIKLLDKLNNVEFYCFSKDVSTKDLKTFKRNKIINIATTFDDFSKTAAAIENLDILVSSDCGVLNLAGAMGKKTLGIFSYHYEFRWFDLNDVDCGWFSSIRPIVNDKYNNWEKSVLKALDEIRKFQKELK